ncbi:uncharacterized protein B0T15DRAFT_549733 [Chaetomium strumarium]|uniref:Uncharacterized protein n=1 Tax=Chaetomium strumarium TaxID=1170767 RepID=A0AAJ0GX82_9PEZI|nr:hypothetical protein B0T15DRAFT_549733 [Chaetomium strumarium]
MDGSDGELGEDHYPWSALAASRGVSTPSPKQHQGPFPTSPSSLTVDGSPKGSESDGETESYGAQFLDGHPGSARDSTFPGADSTVPRHFSRPPPPPPLTPPTLSAGAFPFEDRRPGYATSVPPALDMSFIHQPNPDYGASATSTDALSSSAQTALPRRRSYTRSIPIGIPTASTPASSSITETDTSTASGRSTLHNSFAPSSHPQASFFLPPPPPGHYDNVPPSAPPEYEFVGGPGGPGVEIDVQGEIISVVDDAGHGWTRHTRVYGGGVCLACLAAAERHGPGQGGFYGDKVPLEDRRDIHMHRCEFAVRENGGELGDRAKGA